MDKFFHQLRDYPEYLECDSRDLLARDVLERLDHIGNDQRLGVSEPLSRALLEGEDPEVQKGVVDDLQVVYVLRDDVFEAE